MGGIDLSWLAGGLVAAAVYGALGPRVHARYLPLSSETAASQPLAEDAVANLVND
jgi:toxin CptA